MNASTHRLAMGLGVALSSAGQVTACGPTPEEILPPHGTGPVETAPPAAMEPATPPPVDPSLPPPANPNAPETTPPPTEGSAPRPSSGG